MKRLCLGANIERKEAIIGRYPIIYVRVLLYLFAVLSTFGGPFHTNLLFIVVGFVVGKGALLTVVGKIWRESHSGYDKHTRITSR